MISSPGCECRGAVVPGSSHDHLDYLASGVAQVVPLEIDAPGADLLRLRHLHRQAAMAISAAIAMIRVDFMKIPSIDS